MLTDLPATDRGRRVICSGNPVLYVHQPAQFTVDTRHAGPGELVVFCDQPRSVDPESDRHQQPQPASSDVIDRQDGTFIVYVTAHDVGPHTLHVRYADHPVTGSPFALRVSSANLVTVSGPGLEHGVMSTFNPSFVVDATDAAGPGEVKVKVGGQPGTFKVQTKVIGRRLRCSYNAMAIGSYTVHITWTDDPVPGSPFHVSVFETENQLQKYLAGHKNSCVVS